MVPALGGVLLWVAILGCALLRPWGGDWHAAGAHEPEPVPGDDGEIPFMDDESRAFWADEATGVFPFEEPGSGEQRAAEPQGGGPLSEGAASGDLRGDPAPLRRRAPEGPPAAQAHPVPAAPHILPMPAAAQALPLPNAAQAHPVPAAPHILPMPAAG
ncbi:hypothetical protein MPTA5024_18405, partial [Microbispora sp. ATCC PTA-5024]